MKTIEILDACFNTPAWVTDIQSMVKATIRRHSWVEADELIHQAVVEMLESPDEVRAKTREEAREWFRTNTRRRFLNEHKRRRRSISIADIPEPEVRHQAEGLQEERRRIVRERIDQLSDGDRELVHFRYFENMSTMEIAQRRGQKPMAIEKALYRIRRRLGAILKEAPEIRTLSEN